MKIELNSTRIMNWICVLLILVMVAMLFTPYWQYTTKEKNPETGKREEVTKVLSINDYVWFPREHKEMTKEFEAIYDQINKDNGITNKEDKIEFWINDMVLMPALVLMLGVVLGIVSLWYSHVPFSSLLALILGGFGIYGYVACPEYGFICPLPEFVETAVVGNPLIHIIISGITAAVGLAGVVWFIIKTVQAKKAK